MDLAPNSSYLFRIEAIGSSHTAGQCELFITFNQKATSPLVTTAAPVSEAVISGPGTTFVQ
jgi:hypothetical protein